MIFYVICNNNRCKNNLRTYINLKTFFGRGIRSFSAVQHERIDSAIIWL